MLLFHALVGLAAASQIPLQLPTMGKESPELEFKFREGPDIFTPKNLVELERPGAGVANPAENLALVPVSKYSFEDKETHKSVWVASLDAKIPPVEYALKKGGETFWLDSKTIAHVVPGEDGKGQQVYSLGVEHSSHELTISNSPSLIGSFPPSADATNFKFSRDSDTLVFSSYVWPDANLSTIKEQDEEYEKRGNNALVYDVTYPRHWDTWRGKKRTQLFTVSLSKDKEGKWSLGESYKAPLKGTNQFVPVEPFGGAEDYDVSKTHIVYTTKDPKLDDAWHTRQNVYLVPLDASEAPKELTNGEQGATHNPVFSRDGSKVAWLEMAEDGYEADRQKIILLDLSTSSRLVLTPTWDRSPDSLAFTHDDKALVFTAGDHAVIKVFTLPLPEKLDAAEFKEVFPTALTHAHAASGAQPLPDSRILFSQSSYTSPNDLWVLAPAHADSEPASSLVKITRFSESKLQDKDLSAGESFYFTGAENKSVQGWALKPKGWKENSKKKYPAVLLIHGGPQGAWEDQWSTRWNPNVFAQQGYFTIAINPTGSTTFGQEFTDAIAEDWGGKPFVDMKLGWEYVLKTYPEIDTERTVAAGASWGGYAINWIQGHPEYGFGFKALVCHDGVFDSSYNGFSTDELFFFNHEFGGPPWTPKGKELTAKFSPANFVANWSTPQLLIHGSKDYRLAETESIGAFNALQQLGIPSRLVIFPTENHWVLNPGNSLKWHYEVLRWFDQFVGEKE
ncbi:alpha/beta-hydrolase [Sistotremastrum suecicum HHB10207 ss-3]|uniref:Dipeptidyl-peptidase V n=1 Tax=Sistotremastrum suecicum HHB10207 ss-3 TaxID=1314776 RepID=A0A166A9U8_9AGAM|nr:alpha/beta-hydrolase [Sistotremastrum suecicum HHB10207 ss-3]